MLSAGVLGTGMAWWVWRGQAVGKTKSALIGRWLPTQPEEAPEGCCYINLSLPGHTQVGTNGSLGTQCR